MCTEIYLCRDILFSQKHKLRLKTLLGYSVKYNKYGLEICLRRTKDFFVFYFYEEKYF